MVAGTAASGAGTVSIGNAAGRSNTGVNTFIGYQSGYTATSANATTTGTGQTCLGWNTGQNVTSATAPNYITCIGYGVQAGASGAVAIGVDSGGTGSSTTTANQFQLGTANHTVNFPGKVSIPTGGAAAIAGTGTLTGGTVTISTTAVTASSLIFLQDTASSVTNVGTLTVSAKSAGTSFTVTSSSALDTSTFNWHIIN
jgi:hypothetical protein